LKKEWEQAARTLRRFKLVQRSCSLFPLFLQLLNNSL
jgi:hypothetical protein